MYRSNNPLTTKFLSNTGSLNDLLMLLIISRVDKPAEQGYRKFVTYLEL